MSDFPHDSWSALPSDIRDACRQSRNRRRAWNQAPPSGTTALNVGVAATSTAGTQASAKATDGQYLSGTTAASAGSLGGRISSSVACIDHRPIAAVTGKTSSSIADVRLFMGMSDTGPDGTDAPTGIAAWFIYSPTIGATWQFMVSESTTPTNVSFNTGLTVAINTRYEAWIVAPGDGYVYGFMGVNRQRLMGPFRLAIPALMDTTQLMSSYCEAEATAASAKAVLWGKFDWELD